MKMKIAFLMMFIVSVNIVNAQDRSNEERAKLLTENMKKNLTLTEDQYEKAYTINLAFVNKASQIRNGGGGRLSKGRKLKLADSERDKMLKGVLTAEQYKQYKQQKSENRDRMKKQYEQRKENG